MLDHVSITVSDMTRGARFWDAIMAALGVPCVWREANAIGYGERNSPADDTRTYLTIRLHGDGAPGTFEAAGRHWCFRAPSRAAIEAFHVAGLENGGVCDGPPGLRPQYHEHYYAAFLRDPDGNRIEAVRHRPE
jgi:catechol 2,3-dioxygenase-like lactoylglutathione lyase family enzyme